MALRWIEHRGVPILHIDYRDTNSLEEMLELLDRSVAIEVSNPGLLEIGDFRDITVPLGYIEEVTTLGHYHRKKYVGKCGVIGLRGVKKFLYNTYVKLTKDKTVKGCQSFEEALEWLVSDYVDSDGTIKKCIESELAV